MRRGSLSITAMIAVLTLLAQTRAEPGADAPAEIVGKVVKVVDGDTIHVYVRDGKKTVKIRMEEIDAPEGGQDYGSKSQRALAKRIAGKQVKVKTNGTDKDGLTIGIVYLDKEEINRWTVENGWAWHFTKYSESKALASAEEKARKAKAGLWAGVAPLAPWAWRDEKEKARPAEKKRKQAAALVAGSIGGMELDPPPGGGVPMGQPDEDAALARTVYVTKATSKYHFSSKCRHAGKNPISMSLRKADDRDSPCSLCCPPSSKAK